MMLYEKIRLGCEKYHQHEYAYDGYYRSYRDAKNQPKWNNPDRLDCDEVKRLVRFANEWGSRIPKNGETIRRLLTSLTDVVPRLNTLKSATLLDVKFDESTMQMIQECFDAITRSPVKNDGVTKIRRHVGTSKMLHVAINPELFVMWDNDIQSAHIAQTARSLRINLSPGNAGVLYAGLFLPKMQRIANQAVDEVVSRENRSRANAIQSFTDRCQKKNTLAKIIDEYNFAKFKRDWL